MWQNIWQFRLFIISIYAGMIFLTGCDKLGHSKLGTDLSKMNKEVQESDNSLYPSGFEQLYYEKFAKQMTTNWSKAIGASGMEALKGLPKDPYGMVNWTTAVYEGYIAPLGGLGFDVREERPLKLNVFIEAKVPLMFNVLFPHEIHTYWLGCKVCHPGIFIEKAGANPISMKEIFQGKWCGRCHGKVAFPFWPKSNCNRCHIVPKGMSLQPEKF